MKRLFHKLYKFLLLFKFEYMKTMKDVKKSGLLFFFSPHISVLIFVKRIYFFISK